MKKYIIKQNLSDGEKYKLSLLIMIRAQIVKKMLRVILLPVIIITILIAVSASLGPMPEGVKMESPSSSILPMLIFPSIIILLLVLGPFIMIKLKKMDTVTYEFDDWGMTIFRNDKTFNIPWHEISTYTELAQFLLIAQTNNELSTHIIPKNEFKDNNELREFINFLNQQKLKRK